MQLLDFWKKKIRRKNYFSLKNLFTYGVTFVIYTQLYRFKKLLLLNNNPLFDYSHMIWFITNNL